MVFFLRRHWLIIMVMLGLPVILQAQPYQPETQDDLMREIAMILDDEDFENAFWGIHIKDLSKGTTLFQRNSRKSFMPASNTKLYTTATGLELLGPDFRYQTDLFYEGTIEDSVLYGSLIVRGSGDPTIGGRYHEDDHTWIFRQWADALKDAGIAAIQGDIIGDDRIFDDIPLGLGWAWDNATYSYSAQLSGLSFNENCIDVEIIGTQRGRPARILHEPLSTSYVNILNNTLTIPFGSEPLDRYQRFEGTNDINITSLVREGDTITTSLSVHSPTLFFTHVLRETLIREGIPVFGGIRDIARVPIKPDYDKQATLVTSYYSEPLAQITATTNKESQNLYAEQLLKTIGLLDTEEVSENHPVQGSHEGGLRVQLNFLADAGLDTSRVLLVDGSGLSRRNMVTPEMTTTLLTYMWNHPDEEVREAFLNSLPVAGIDGTLETRFHSSLSFNNARAKTGYVSNVRSLSGYVNSSNKSPLVFSIMSNHYTASTHKINKLHEKIVNLLAGYLL
ncbi:MAG: D-alanyl-D-alanine carboxypeptidase/D-alanyl-D-alanine-endopeptidase [Balneolales bacterium]